MSANARLKGRPERRPDPCLPRFKPWAAGDQDATVPSPALQLQDRIEDAFTFYSEPEVDKFHPATRLAILLSLTAGCWGAVLATAKVILGS